MLALGRERLPDFPDYTLFGREEILIVMVGVLGAAISMLSATNSSAKYISIHLVEQASYCCTHVLI